MKLPKCAGNCSGKGQGLEPSELVYCTKLQQGGQQKKNPRDLEREESGELTRRMEPGSGQVRRTPNPTNRPKAMLSVKLVI